MEGPPCLTGGLHPLAHPPTCLPRICGPRIQGQAQGQGGTRPRPQVSPGWRWAWTSTCEGGAGEAPCNAGCGRGHDLGTAGS